MQKNSLIQMKTITKYIKSHTNGSALTNYLITHYNHTSPTVANNYYNPDDATIMPFSTINHKIEAVLLEYVNKQISRDEVKERLTDLLDKFFSMLDSEEVKHMATLIDPNNLEYNN